MLMWGEGEFCIGQGGLRGGVVIEEGGFLVVGGLVKKKLIEVKIGMRMWV